MNASDDIKVNGPSESAPATLAQLHAWIGKYETRVGEEAARQAQRHCQRWRQACTPAAVKIWLAARDVWLPGVVSADQLSLGVNRLALLDAAGLRKVLSARVLYRSRAGLRRVVARSQREQLLAAVGERALECLQREDAVVAASAPPLPASFTAASLAADGWQLIQSEDAGLAPAAAALIAFALASEEIADIAMAEVAGGSLDKRCLSGQLSGNGESARFFSKLGSFFPEMQWLFG
ncbi:bacterial type III secretion family protein [Collimonas fungivorans]|uniref:Bacterial type III secretion family protein n=1 Tax=Collimonas fungivorans TaxID=158899 RepID=A0A127PJ83_9BURK|nr:type III secretion protein HrpB4 [Collimonas fungivorans]AMO97830.1 bacterial type III secretion family protein [Collimonas fungivorans]